ncbi:MAG: ParB N-terminal domain-containing protein [Acidobacteria bacterium]|nr:ParB N-terminal domain-containing protein [Acidobacteriota bacterium]
MASVIESRVAPAMAKRIELWPVEKLVPFARNARTHSDAQVAQIAGSIAEFGFNAPLLVDTNSGIIAGHGRLLAARKLGLTEVPVIVLDHLSETQKRAYIIADNKLSELAGWNEEVLASEFAALEQEGFDLALTGFSDAELEALLTTHDEGDSAESPEEIPEAPAVAVTQPGDLWLIGPHRLLCGDCRDQETVLRLFDGVKANVVITSPPYASQREYDPASGFRPVAPEDYIAWYRDVAANIESVLAPDGSYFLNIKEHAEDGQRLLYVKELTIAHVRQWGWRFVDEFCWRKTDNGVPGGWGNRFKNAWEPIHHFCRQRQIKFRPDAVGHLSDGCFDYSPDTPESNSGSGLLGQHEDRHMGIARPSNVIEAKTESSQGSHSAPFPRAIPEFFIKAFSDPSDVVFDPFLGSGTTMAAAALLNRAGYGIEISPAYCDVIIRRLQNLLPDTPALLAGTNQSFEEVSNARGISPEIAGKPRELDSRAIKHRGPAPYYGKRPAVK